MQTAGPRKRDAAAAESCSAKKPRRRMLRAGDYVAWFCHDTQRHREAQILRTDGDMLVVTDHTSMFTLCPVSLPGLVRADWRDRVKVGDVLFVRVPGCDRQPAVVREVGAELTLEPAFLGKTLRVPLTSVTLSSAAPALHPNVRALLASGLAFDDAHARTRSVHVPAAVTTTWALRQGAYAAHAWNNTAGWEIAPPCGLPDHTRMLRTEGGELVLCHDVDLIAGAPLRPPTRVRLGTVRVGIAAPPSAVNAETLNARLFFQHLRNGDTELAARVLYFNAGRLVHADHAGVSLDLVTALALCACHPLYSNTSDDYHPVSRRVWQHNNFHIAGLADTDLEQLTQSVMRMKYTCPQANRTALDALMLRLHIWSHYKKEWGNARKIQLFYESVRPVQVRVVGARPSDAHPDTLWTLEFEVTAHVSHDGTLMSPHAQENAVNNLRYVTTVLEHFTTPAPCWNPAQHADFVRTAPVSWTSAVALVSRVPEGISLAQRVLRREKLDTTELCLTRRAASEDLDYTTIPWNVCQGPVWGPAEAPEVAPEGAPGHPAPRRGGVILLHNCPRRKVDDVARVLLAETQGLHVPTPADRGSTIIVTTATLLCDWQRHLTRHGVPSHVFCGAGRRGPAATQCLHRGDVLLVTYRALCHADDLAFLRGAPTPPWRLVLDEVTAVGNVPHFLRALMQWQLPHVWVLTQKPTKDVLAFALPLLRVHPFVLHNAFGVHHDLRKSTYIRSLLSTGNFADTPASRVHQNTLFTLCKTLFVNRARRKPALQLRVVNHVPAGGYSAVQQSMFAALRKRLYFADDGLRLDSCAGYAKSLRTAHLCAWGVPPPLALVSTKLTVGNYRLDAATHAARLRTSPLDSRRRAADLCAALGDGTFADANPPACSICMETLGAAPDDPDDADDPLQTAVVVGMCGHAVCGACADHIHRVARENRATNDYGPSAPVNRPSCPVCRQGWTLAPPLLHPTRPGVWFRRHRHAVFRMDCDVRPCPDSPLVDALRRALVAVRAQDPAERVVVVCHSSELVRFLHTSAGVGAATCKLEGNMSPLSRGKALHKFRRGASRTLFATASLLRGLAFDTVKHYVVAEPLCAEEKDKLKTLMRSATHAAVVVHTLQVPTVSTVSPGTATAGAGGIPTLPDLRHEYIQALDALFGGHTPVGISGTLEV